jgi:hypothetical protein
MLNLNLHVRPQTAERLKKILALSPNEETFAQNVIAYQVAEIKRAMLNLRLDLNVLEAQYHLSSADFYTQYQSGQMGDDEDFMRWAGLFEMLQNNEQHLQGLEG